MIHISSKYLSQEKKAMVVGSKEEALEAEATKLKRDLITVRDEANTAKEKNKTLANELKVKKQLTVRKDK